MCGLTARTANRRYVCLPAGLLAYPHEHGARILQDALPADACTIAHHFGKHGYQTAAIGKMHFVDETIETWV